MPEFSSIGGGVPVSHGATASSQGTSITAGNTTKGSYVEVVSATTFDANWMSVELGSTGTGGTSLTDIAVGSATEQIIIPDLFIYSRGSGQGVQYLFPLFVPKGTRIAARSEGSSTFTTLVRIHMIAGTLSSSPGVARIVERIGTPASQLGVNVDPGATANTKGSWVEMTSATTRDLSWLAIGIHGGDGVAANGDSWLLDVGVGAATEQVIIGDIPILAGATIDHPTPQTAHFPVSIPAGTRVSVRAQSSTNDSGNRQLYIMLYGC